MRGLVVATQFLTRLPTPRLDDWRADDLSRAAPWFPAVGLIIGALVAAAVWAGSLINPTIAALAGVLAMTVATGALHLDGLADTADGLAASHRDPKRFLEVARDPATGAFGVVAIVIALLAKFALLQSLGPVDLWTLGAVVCVFGWSRWIAAAIGAAVPPLGEGRAAVFIAGVSRPMLIAMAVILAVASLVTSPVLLIAIAIAPAAIAYWRARLGGINGDGFGATIETSEVLLLAALVIGAQPW
ncbi:MAG: adenosylcobinamide-GDP ribazoletransferase [Pseudomonadota bacterium]